ncbi:hypothetical protein [Pelomonas cellulosilytica]|uniref:Uncharacterized protein n=1 Tax=Pelomonas cellulosilytica TaxID=2906762 RepID=A0ABS8XTH0_9BURK|nr:hypothetical protein [Pelomonas sp. P8]MCE4553896.1 hypothetical protein [Pelomonas sp. P8]
MHLHTQPLVVAHNSQSAATSVYCFETVLLGLLEMRGFDLIQARVHRKWAKLPGQTVDGMVLQAFPQGGTEQQALAVLHEALSTLKASLPPIQFV